ncbi:hypothetical protein HBI26_149010 [Parastagonospora nodorum]|nr:hypothetical protein HBH75_005060 [Parastagonospora nodorum]KAH5572597.1 hypothetical protein HBI26_149010 [Parastagonospora nodorum]KAH6022853.1 hypothetical protein HBI82_076550 [Parastagonospora nodorum]KAH6213991.1 hypothetical protein HBI43_138780 [Parastagonospora nodorum]KAH6252714.1 hypothetical protein HBI42_143770 [Parastagonospora nodorum]
MTGSFCAPLHDPPLMMASGQNEMTFRYVGQDVREKILQLRKEAKSPLQHVLHVKEELSQADAQLGATRSELMGLNDGTAVLYEGQPDWVFIDKRRDDLMIAFPQEQIEVNRLLGQLRNRELPLHELAERSAALLCRPFVEAIHETLPAELRDQVYDHLWNEDAIDLVDGQLALPYNNVRDERLSQDWVLQAPFFADASIVGESFAREAATYFFRMLTDNEVDYHLLQAYLRIKSFGNIRLHPGEIIRRLRIDVPYQPDPYSFAYADLKRNLESLLDLSVRNDLAVEVFLDRELQFSRNFFHIMDMIRPIYQILVKRDVMIKVLGHRFFTPRWRQDVENTNEAEQKRYITTAEMLNYYFDGTTEEWFTMKDTEIASIKNPRRRQRCHEVLEVMRHNFRDAGVLVWDGVSPRVTWPDEPLPTYTRPAGLFER